MSIEALRDRLAELSDLSALGRLAAWDQRTMMPPAGGAARGEQLGDARAARARARDRRRDRRSGWRRSRPTATWTSVDATIVRLARRDFDRARRVPGELAAEIERRPPPRARTSGRTRARPSDFAAFAPALRAQRRARARVRRVLRRRRPALRRAAGRLRLRADGGARAGRLRRAGARRCRRWSPRPPRGRRRPTSRCPSRRSRRRCSRCCARLGVGDERWRVDVSAHPFSVGVGPRDSRVTTRYEDGDLQSVIGGRARVRPRALRAPDRARAGADEPRPRHLDVGARVPEQAVGEPRRRATRVRAGDRRRARGGRLRGRRRRRCTPSLVAVRPSLIRVSADQVTYPLHIVLRFELELALIEGTLDVADLPGRVERRHAAAARRRGPRRRRAACCRTSTGRPAPSATSRATRSAASSPRSCGRRSSTTSAPRTRRCARADVDRDPRLARRARPPPRPPARHRAAGGARDRPRHGGRAVPAPRARARRRAMTRHGGCGRGTRRPLAPKLCESPRASRGRGRCRAGRPRVRTLGPRPRADGAVLLAHSGLQSPAVSPQA